jgi:hypothetical protein
MLDWKFIQHGRREILAIANEFGITGFCLPGKPGIICVEGLPRDCIVERQRYSSRMKNNNGTLVE